jgi:hypothetical protein
MKLLGFGCVCGFQCRSDGREVLYYKNETRFGIFILSIVNSEGFGSWRSWPNLMCCHSKCPEGRGEAINRRVGDI